MRKLPLFAWILAITIIPTLLIWAPFYFGVEKLWGIPLPSGGMQVVASNYDGPLYIAVAKSFYGRDQILNNFSFSLPYEYYAAHFPLFPVIIRLLGYILGNIWGMLGASVLGAFVAHLYLYKIIKLLTKNEARALFVTFVFSILPARWLIVRSVGAPETWFVGFVLASIYYFRQKKFLLAGMFGALAQATKSPGILLFVSYFVYLSLWQFKRLALSKNLGAWLKAFPFRSFYLLLIPLSLIGVFFIYKNTFGNFLAYFESGDNIHLFFPPFQIFNFSQPWVNTHWLEEVIFIYLFGGLTIIKLAKKKLWEYLIFFVVFFVSLLFVSHRDLLRYAMPIVPLTFVAFNKYIYRSNFKWVLAFLILPSYIYAIAFIASNTMQISNWGPFL